MRAPSRSSLVRALLLASAGALLLAALAVLAEPPSAPVAREPVGLAAGGSPDDVRELPSVPSAPWISPSPHPAPALDDLRISVPRLGIDLPLRSGDIARDVPRPNYPGETPERVALVFPGSAALASGGNTFIYAHARAGMFIELWNVRLDDVVLISGRDVTLRYVVHRVVPRVDPSDTSWLDPRGPERLTLQTSTGPYPADPRFIVVADLASSSARPIVP